MSNITLLDEFQNLKENIEHIQSKYKNEILELNSDLKKWLNSDKQQYEQLGKIESSLSKINQSLSELSQTKEEIQSSVSKEVYHQPMTEISNVYSPLAESDSSAAYLLKGARPKSHTISSTTSSQQSNYCQLTQPKPSFHNLPLPSLYQEARIVKNSTCGFYPVSDIQDVTSINATTKGTSNL